MQDCWTQETLDVALSAEGQKAKRKLLSKFSTKLEVGL